MSENSKVSSTIKIFLASPSDVEGERDALSALVREINDVLAFLAPDRALRLQLVRYETDTYPDIGQAQEVINRQIPVDYDIFVGVMWKRVGTPTATSSSGTIEEFRRALDHRQNNGRPVIMFYFCDEPVPFPRGDDLNQLSGVVKFREELSSIGYTLSYPSRAAFRDHVRGGLLRAVADLLGANIKLAPAASEALAPASIAPVTDEDRRAMSQLALQYEEARRTMQPGPDRTRLMTQIAAAMRLKAASVRSLLAEYQNNITAGFRLAAIAIIRQFPDPAHLPWLAERLDPDKESAFIGYNAAVALAQSVRSLPATAGSILMKSITDALSLAKRNPNDPPRIDVLEMALKELKAKIQ
jgi:hypothetical protein